MRINIKSPETVVALGLLGLGLISTYRSLSSVPSTDMAALHRSDMALFERDPKKPHVLTGDCPKCEDIRENKKIPPLMYRLATLEDSYTFKGWQWNNSCVLQIDDIRGGRSLVDIDREIVRKRIGKLYNSAIKEVCRGLPLFTLTIETPGQVESR